LLLLTSLAANDYSPNFEGYAFRLTRRIAFFFSTRRISLLETNQRLRRMVLKTPLFTTFLRNRFSSESCDSFGRRTTVAIGFSPPFARGIKNKPRGCAVENLYHQEKQLAIQNLFQSPLHFTDIKWLSRSNQILL